MNHPFIFRAGTIDEDIFHNVNIYNEYRLPDIFQPDDIIIDIGAHIGSFCYAALQRGSNNVYGFEAQADNYARATENLRSFGERVQVCHQAVWRSDKAISRLSFARSDVTTNTGGGSIVWEHRGEEEVDIVALDDLLTRVTHGGAQQVRLLKVDCEGSEYPILFTSRKLHLVDAICGEFHEFGGAYDQHNNIPERAKVAGFERFTIDELIDVLERQGFNVSWSRYLDTNLGFFSAFRQPPAGLAAKQGLSKRFVSWAIQSYGQQTAPGVISRSSLRLDGYEGSHLAGNWYDAEQDFRWTGRSAIVFLHRTHGQDTIELELSSGPEPLGPARVIVEADGATLAQDLSSSSWQLLRLRLPTLNAEQAILRVVIAVERTRYAGQLGADDQRQLGVAVRAVRLSGWPRSTGLALSSVCNPDHWKDPFWRRTLDAMAFRTEYGVIAPEQLHRKMWEWVHGVSGLARLGCLRPGAHALGIAVGHEPVIYWLASRVAKVYATDLYSGRFANNEANPDILHEPAKYAPYPYPHDRVHFLPMSGTHFCFDDETIDFVFSFCSIEHFGSRANSRQSLQEMKRVLRPGGIAAVSTEVLLNDAPPQPEIFSPWELYEELIAPSGLRLIGDIAPAGLRPFCADPIDIQDPVRTNQIPHFVLRDRDAVFTSVMLFLQKV